MKTLRTAFFCAIVVAFYSCSPTATEPTKPTTDIDALVRGAGNVNTSLAEKNPTLQNTTSNTTTIDGKKYDVVEKKYNMSKNLDNNILATNPNANTLWAGALVQGNQVPNGILNSIGDNIPRTPITLTAKSGDKLFGSTTIENPTNAKYSSSLSTILSSVTGNTSANVIFQHSEAYSTEQACMNLGMSANWLVASVKGSFSIDNSSTEKNFFIFFKQEYYTVSVNEPAKPSDYFGNAVDINDLKANVTSGNPLCYVASVTYGRLLMAKMTYKGSKSMQTINAEVQAAFGGGSGGYKGGLDKSEYTFKGFILGGSAGGATKALTGSSVESIKQFINEEANYSSASPGYPISYTVKNLSDNSIVKLGETTDYTVREYTESSGNYQDFSLRIEGFYVMNDCEPIGNGDFYYDLDVKDQDGKSLIGGTVSVASNQTVPAGDAAWIYLLKKDYDFRLSNAQSSYFSVTGKLSEDNSVVADIDLPFNQKFSYPWNQSDIQNTYKLGTQPGYFGVEMFRDAGCKVVLLIKITKK